MSISTGVRMQSEYVMSKIKHSKEVISLINHLRHFDKSEIAKERQRIITFYEHNGEKATKEAFNVDRKIIYVWNRRVKIRKGIQGLVPDSQAPKMPRKSVVNSKIVDFIKAKREFVPRMSKKKLKPLLDEFCLSENIKTISVPTIGRIIKRNNFFFYKQGRMYHNPASKWAQNSVKRKKRERIKHSPKPKDFGHIQIDTVLKVIDGQRWYMYQAIDVKGKSALSLTYKTLNAKNTIDFFKKFTFFLPSQVVIVQTDNGPEFLGDFDEYLKQQNIIHLFTYPRCPKVNGVIERFNRTIQEEFIDPNLHLIYNQPEYNRKLADYLIYYNCQRVHESLNDTTPTNYLIQKGGMSNMLGSYTPSCILFVNSLY